MRLGGPVYDWTTSREWIDAHRQAGYTAAYWPNVEEGLIDEFARAAANADLVIAEVGAWSNPLSLDEAERARNLAHCKSRLAAAERVGARCCVNIAGSLGKVWHGPCPRDLTDEAFDRIVATVQEIIDAVGPTRTHYALETMQWMYPDSADSYLRLLEAIDRPGMAAHMDPVNLVNCPRLYFHSGEMIRDAFAKLGPQIRSCHAKDILLGPDMTVHLSEVAPGEGGLAYDVYLHELARLDPDMPLMLEHLKREQYSAAAAFIRRLAVECGLTFV